MKSRRLKRAGGRVEFSAGVGADAVDAVLDVYDSTGRVLAHNDNQPGNSNVSRVALDTTAGQFYYIRVRGRGKSIGQFELAIDWLLERGL